MQLNWSHAVIYVRDLDIMLDFYTRVLGFKVTDRGPLGDGAPEVVFISQHPREHHQLAMVPVRQGEEGSNSVNHFAFRVDTFEEISDLNKALAALEGVNVDPVSHGNTLSLYFNDPDGNGLEVFWETPWHVRQPQIRPWDPGLNRQEALAWVEQTFSDMPGFGPAGKYYETRWAGRSGSSGSRIRNCSKN